jgi:hypothetical protein
MPCYSRRIVGERLTIASNAAALVVPVDGTSGVAIPATWKMQQLQRAFRQLSLEIIGNAVAARTLTDVKIYGFDGTNWWLLASFGTVTTEATAGISIIVNDVAVWTRVAVSADTVSGNVDVFLTPMDAAGVQG